MVLSRFPYGASLQSEFLWIVCLVFLLRWGRPTITVGFGEPLRLTGDPAKSADARRETQRVMQAIAALLTYGRRPVSASINAGAGEE